MRHNNIEFFIMSTEETIRVSSENDMPTEESTLVPSENDMPTEESTPVASENEMSTEETIRVPLESEFGEDAQIDDGHDILSETEVDSNLDSVPSTKAQNLTETEKSISTSSSKSGTGKKKASKKGKKTQKEMIHFKTLKKEERKQKNKTIKKLHGKVNESIRILTRIKEDLLKLKM